MADPDLSTLKIQQYVVDNGGGWRPRKRVRLALRRRDRFGATVDSYTVSISERNLLKALGDAGYYVVTEKDLGRV